MLFILNKSIILIGDLFIIIENYFIYTLYNLYVTHTINKYTSIGANSEGSF